MINGSKRTTPAGGELWSNRQEPSGFPLPPGACIFDLLFCQAIGRVIATQGLKCANGDRFAQRERVRTSSPPRSGRRTAGGASAGPAANRKVSRGRGLQARQVPPAEF